MNSPQSGITLVQKKGALVPQRSERKSTLEANGYTLGKTLGEGAYAKVKLAISTKQNCHVAIKVINKRRASKEYLAKFLPREIQVLQRLKYPYVVRAVQFERHFFFISFDAYENRQAENCFVRKETKKDKVNVSETIS